MSRELLENIAYEKGLEYVETTTGMNGYPQHLRGAIIGFETFEEAEEVAQEHGLRITTFFKRDGWQLYQRESGTTYRALHITASDYGDDYSQLETSDSRDFFENEVKPFLADVDSFSSLHSLLSEKEKLYDYLDGINDGQIIITRCGEYYETIDRELMSWSHDGKTWVIGVMEED